MGNFSIRYRDQAIVFPAVDDIESLPVERAVDRRLAFSTNGKPEAVMLVPVDRVQARIADVVTDSVIDDLEAWWSHARRGQEYSVAFDDDNRIATALEANAAAGDTAIQVSDLAGISASTRLLIVHDILGRNTSQNGLPSAQSLCQSPGDFGTAGTPGTLTAVGSPKVGTNAIKFDAPASGDSMFTTLGPAISANTFVTFSIWYRDQSAASSFRLRIQGPSSTIKLGPAIVNTATGLFRRTSFTAFFSAAETSLTVAIESIAGAAQSIVVDAWQLEVDKLHATPWEDGATTADQKTTSVDGFAEIVTVASIDGALENTLNLSGGLKFDYKKRDFVKSLQYWERVVSIDTVSPFLLKQFTHAFRHRFREVP